LQLTGSEVVQTVSCHYDCC